MSESSVVTMVAQHVLAMVFHTFQSKTPSVRLHQHLGQQASTFVLNALEPLVLIVASNIVSQG